MRKITIRFVVIAVSAFFAVTAYGQETTATASVVNGERQVVVNHLDGTAPIVYKGKQAEAMLAPKPTSSSIAAPAATATDVVFTKHANGTITKTCGNTTQTIHEIQPMTLPAQGNTALAPVSTTAAQETVIITKHPDGTVTKVFTGVTKVIK